MHRTPEANRYLQSQSLQKQLQSNQQDIYILNRRDFLKLFIADKKRRFGWSEERVQLWLKDHAVDMGDKALSLLSSYGTTANDSRTLFTLAKEMIRCGGILTTYREVMQNGRKYIIFKGHPGLRKVLSATRYSVDNPKVMAMAVGKAALKAGAKMGFVLGMAFSVAFDLEHFRTHDKETIPSLIAHITSDVVKNAVSTGIGLAVGLLAAGAGTAAIVPLAAGIVVGVIVGSMLKWFDDRYHITEQLAAAITKVVSQMNQQIKNSLQTQIQSAQGMAAYQQAINSGWAF